jgi:hypothetical protein
VSRRDILLDECLRYSALIGTQPTGRRAVLRARHRCLCIGFGFGVRFGVSVGVSVAVAVAAMVGSPHPDVEVL